ncbi:MAG TPA: peptidoglycan DD-metalloendopeptidase family protein, partial [Myxococcaceae bacterium]|nr:peptidoglycan DD-metalloendopeptidase family protein [Myxococcaceae bacterium]
GGPHGWGGSARPWSALDLNGGDGRVLAAREGFVYKMCGTSTWLQVRHSGGWATDYYHLSNMVQFTDGTSIERGRYLGNTGTTVACGGSASGPHVHFNLRLNGAHAAMNGREMGGWTFWEGAAAYQGFAERSGVRVGVNSLMYNPGIQYQSNVEGIGWQGAQANGGTTGTTGQNRRLEAINISLQRPTGTPGSFDVCYEAHVQNIGWQGVRCNAQTAGTVGQGLRMEALKIWLVNPPNRAGVCYRAYVQNIGWQSWVCNGAIAGTTGQSLRIEALQIKLTP